ncbi:YkgJ family cysteine cluster protein [Breznakiella homolactica]|uniref:YkgJ family cysteine cluster protein n=1 Tax=Breznakiella homolactica TaxID=2798577 RepID=A0A7T8B832_9SPIR|nr:YkgJ family cysteine cluster protein [Breznakiella homolactica]QQO08149.1 YkgJ family cysteine cluster protein [Breznakiella homolactica]
MADKPFYSQGLPFSCQRCSSCCRHDPGFVFLSEKDVNKLARALKMRYISFVETFCRWIPAGGGTEQLSLKELSNFDCVFWKEGCTVYESRPLQCRTFPFWHSIVASRDYWDIYKQDCPGIGRGPVRSMAEIDSCLAQRVLEPVITRKQKE